MWHRIETAKSTMKCATCARTIARGDVRVAELYQRADSERKARRYHHIECAIAAIPEIVRRASFSIERGLPIDRAQLEVRLAAQIAGPRTERREQYLATLPARIEAGPAHPDEVVRTLLQQLIENPERDLLAVLADQLQACGDPRGELIALQLALNENSDPRFATAVDRGALISRRDELMTQLAPTLELGERYAWGIGFIQRVELIATTQVRLSAIASLWRHPSLSVVTEVQVDHPIPFDPDLLAGALEPVVSNLRWFALGGCNHGLPGVSALIATMPRLAHVGLTERADVERLAHPTLCEVALSATTETRSIVVDAVRRLSRPALPAVRRLVLRHTSSHTDEICEELARSGWLEQVSHLDLLGGTLGQRGISALAHGLGGRKLARLDVSGNAMPMTSRSVLAGLCDELLFPGQVLPDKLIWVEHANKPAWGRGRLVRRRDDKLEVKFPNAGTKVFRADAPFLKLILDEP